MRARPRLGDLPNVLSLSRVLLAAGFVAADGAALRAGLIGVAGLSDALDGWLARRLNAATLSGALIDPIADRIFVVAAAVTLVASDVLTTPAAVVLMARDIATAIGFFVALGVPRLRPREFRARVSGKVVTVLQFMALFCAVVVPALFGPALVLVAVTAAWSILDYTLAGWRGGA